MLPSRRTLAILDEGTPSIGPRLHRESWPGRERLSRSVLRRSCWRREKGGGAFAQGSRRRPNIGAPRPPRAQGSATGCRAFPSPTGELRPVSRGSEGRRGPELGPRRREDSKPSRGHTGLSLVGTWKVGPVTWPWIRLGGLFPSSRHRLEIREILSHVRAGHGVESRLTLPPSSLSTSIHGREAHETRAPSGRTRARPPPGIHNALGLRLIQCRSGGRTLPSGTLTTQHTAEAGRPSNVCCCNHIREGRAAARATGIRSDREDGTVPGGSRLTGSLAHLAQITHRPSPRTKGRPHPALSCLQGAGGE